MKSKLLRSRINLKNMGFQGKLFISDIFILLLFLFLAVTLNYRNTTTNMRNEAIYSANQTLQQTAAYIGYKANAIKNIIDIVSYDDTIQEVISTNSAYYRKDIGNWIIQTSKVRNILYNTYTTPDISSIHLYMKDGPAAIEESDEFHRMSSAEKANWYTALQNSSSLYIWFPIEESDNNKSYLSFIKKIANAGRINDFIGIISAEVPQSVFQEIAKQASTTPDTDVLIFNSYNQLIAQYGESTYSIETILDAFNTENIQSNRPVQQIYLDDVSYIAGMQGIEGTDWSVVLLTPMDDVLGSATLYRNQMYKTSLLLFVFGIPIILLISHSITSRLRILEQEMREVAQGKLDPIKEDNANDEIGKLTHTFNYTITQISSLMKEQYRLGQEIKSLELNVLQSQINPHFLYNTLDLINWLGLYNNVPDVVKASTALASFYKLSLGHGEKIVTLENEINHAAVYVEIQNMRFGNRIILNNQISEELYKFKMLKITLQPLIENAIQHGIRERDDETGTITLSASLKSGIITISVSDDGVGMSPDVLCKILDESEEKKKEYGVKNINKRIKLNYGNDYGLSYQSEQGMGTTVYIRFPAQSE